MSQLFETHLSGGLDKVISARIVNILQDQPMLLAKLQHLVNVHRRRPFLDKYASERTNLATVFNHNTNMSRRYRLLQRQLLDETIETAPAYNTRRRDGVNLPERNTFNTSYKVLNIPIITSKTKETIFQILNRTIWTNNKAFKSRMRPDPNCDRCNNLETMEHLLYECEFYSSLIWDQLGTAFTRQFNTMTEDYVPRVELNFKHIVFNVPHPSILLYIKDKDTRIATIMLIQELKRDIIYRRMNLPPSAREPTHLQRILSHIDQTIGRLISYLQYIGLRKYNDAIKFLQNLQEMNLNNND